MIACTNAHTLKDRFQIGKKRKKGRTIKLKEKGSEARGDTKGRDREIQMQIVVQTMC